MPKKSRSKFRNWIDKQPNPSWIHLPLTHITKGLNAEDILEEKFLKPSFCKIFNEDLVYFFYGRPAFRLKAGEVVNMEAACPYCFIFNFNLANQAKSIYPFDTGAFKNRMYNHILIEGMEIEDFCLESESDRINKLICASFGSLQAYVEGDRSKLVNSETATEPWDMFARAYINLLMSRGRNEPDDRICSIEISTQKEIPIEKHLKAIIVPHTIWNDEKKHPILIELRNLKIEILPYKFIPGYPTEHYHTLLEAEVHKLYEDWEII